MKCLRDCRPSVQIHLYVQAATTPCSIKACHAATPVHLRGRLHVVSFRRRSGDAVISRRSLIGTISALPFAYRLGGMAQAFEGPEGPVPASVPGMTIRETEPQNFEPDFAGLNSFLTPNDRFYVRNHFASPQLDAKTWQLKIEGEVLAPCLELRRTDSYACPNESRHHRVCGKWACVPHTQSGRHAMAAWCRRTAEWTGVPLAALLERAKIGPDSVDVILEGSDAGEVSKPSRPAKPFHYARSISIDEAHWGGILLAYKMNGQPLPPLHGIPLRRSCPAGSGWLRSNG